MIPSPLQSLRTDVTVKAYVSTCSCGGMLLPEPLSERLLLWHVCFLFSSGLQQAVSSPVSKQQLDFTVSKAQFH